MISTRFVADFFVSHRHWVGAFLLLLSGIALLGYLPKSRAPQWPGQNNEENTRAARRDRSIRQAERDFSNRRSQCFLVVEGPDFFTPQTVRILREIVANLEELPQVRDVVWLDRVPPINVFELSRPLLPHDDASPESFELAREQALEHPLVVGQLLAEDCQTLLMTIRYDWFEVVENEDCTKTILAAAQRAIDDHKNETLQVSLTGDVPLYLAYQDSFDRNHRKFTILGYVLVLIMAIFLFRGVSAVIIVALAPALGLFLSMGILNLVDIDPNPLTNVVLPVLISMVGLTDGVHLITHIRKQRDAGHSPIKAASSAIEHVGLACALTSLTTAIGFGSLMLAKSEVIQDFGTSCAIAVLVTFLAVVLSIPYASTTWLGRTIHKGQSRDILERSISYVSPLVDRLLVRPRIMAVLGILLTGFFAYQALHLRPDNRVKNSQPMGSPAYQALSRCDEAMGGVESIGISVTWDGELADETQILTAIEAVHSVLDEEPLIYYPLSINRILAALPGDTPLVERYSFVHLMPKELLERFLVMPEQRAVIVAKVQDQGMALYRPVFQRIEAKLANEKQALPGFEFKLIGNPVRRGRDLHQILIDLTNSLGTASIIIFVVMAFAYRSIRLGLISIVPNMFPLAVTGAVLYWIGHPLEIASVCSFVVCLGIAVDDTIHFLTNFQHLKQKGVETRKAANRSVSEIGVPMLMSTIVLVVGFSSVLTSELPGQRIFAAMACATITAALIGDLMFLPAMLVVFDKQGKQSSTTSTEQEASTRSQ